MHLPGLPLNLKQRQEHNRLYHWVHNHSRWTCIVKYEKSGEQATWACLDINNSFQSGTLGALRQLWNEQGIT